MPVHRYDRRSAERLRSISLRHPGLDPGSTAASKSWAPDQVRGDEAGELHFSSQPTKGATSRSRTHRLSRWSVTSGTGAKR
ncbi:hypothetical protein E5675_06265 [Sphingopyxis sp. PAMC25046]|nr:hypothetical protein E5675_06265 [Sphingopyxis sp. PAMC25046]